LRDPLLARGFQDQLQHRQDVWIANPLGHVCQQEVMADGVEVRLQVDVDDPCFVLHDRVRDAQDSVLRAPLRAVAIRSRLEIRFKDGLQDQLKGSLDHAVADGRNRENADLGAPVFRNRLMPQPHGLIHTGDQFVPNLLKKGFHAAGLDGLKRHPIASWGAVVGLGEPGGFVERFHLADMDVQAPEPPGRFSLRLGVYPPLQVLQTAGRLYHFAPASHMTRGVTTSRVPSLHGHYPASALLRTPPPPSRLQPTSRGTGYTAYLAPSLSQRDAEGFSSCLACPCHRAAAPTPPEYPVASARLRRAMQPSPFRLQARPPGLLIFGATCAFACAAAR
jgi:hypothetical protein